LPTAGTSLSLPTTSCAPHRATTARCSPDAYIPIDDVKRVNDSHGYAIGDDVIKTVAGVLAANLRDHDIVGRLGGEEFAAVMPELLGDLTEAAERIRGGRAGGDIRGPRGTGVDRRERGPRELKPDDALKPLKGWLTRRSPGQAAGTQGGAGGADL
jgi:hypothetical protein